MPGTCVVGLQWGDEAKGKIVDLLGDGFDLVVRYNGGANAGHTVVVNGDSFKLSLLPTGVLRPDVTSVIGNGVVVYPPRFLEEVDSLKKGGIDVSGSLVLSDHAHVIFPYHMEEERLLEAGAEGKIGTTGRGIGPCYQDKVGRRFAIRVGELLHPDHLRERLRFIVPFKNQLMTAFAGGRRAEAVRRRTAIATSTSATPERIKPFVRDTPRCCTTRSRPASGSSSRRRRAACSTSITAPIRTSRVRAACRPASGAVPACRAKYVKRIIGVVKAYTTPRRRGPFPTELDDDTAASASGRSAASTAP